MQTIEQIINFMQLEKTPYFDLKVKSGYSYVNAGKFDGENFISDASEDIKVNKAIDALNLRLSMFPENNLFAIEFRKSKTANGSSKFGPFEFSINRLQQNQNQNFQGLGSIPGYVDFQSLGLVPRSEFELSRKLDRLEWENEDLKGYVFELEEKLKNVPSEDKLSGLIDKFLPIAQNMGWLKGDPSLAGVNNNVVEMTEKQKVINNLGTFLDSELDNETQIKNIFLIVKRLVEIEKTKNNANTIQKTTEN